MKTFDLEGTVRDSVGKTSTKLARFAELVPAVVYGIKEPAHITVEYNAIKKALHSPETYIFNLKVNGETTTAIVKDAQFHPVTDNVIHVDFLRITESNEVEVQLPIKLVGTSVGILNGGKLVPMMRYLKVKGIPSLLPEYVDVDISKITLGKTLKVEDLEFEGLTITSPPSAGVVAVEIPRAVKTDGILEGDEEDEDGEEGAEGEDAAAE